MTFPGWIRIARTPLDLIGSEKVNENESHDSFRERALVISLARFWTRHDWLTVA
jgi:hypothetical protein